MSKPTRCVYESETLLQAAQKLYRAGMPALLVIDSDGASAGIVAFACEPEPVAIVRFQHATASSMPPKFGSTTFIARNDEAGWRPCRS